MRDPALVLGPVRRPRGRVEQRLREFSRSLQMVDLVGRRRIGVRIAIGAQSSSVGKRHGRSKGRLRPPCRAAQSIAHANLISRGLGGGWTLASDWGIDVHRREAGRLLRFRATDRGHGNEAGDRRNLPAGMMIEIHIDQNDR